MKVVVNPFAHLTAMTVTIGIICLLLTSTANGLQSSSSSGGQAKEKDIQVSDDLHSKLTQPKENELNKCGQLHSSSKNWPVDEEKTTEMTTMRTSRSKRSMPLLTNNDNVIDGSSLGYRSVRGGGGLDRNFLRFGRKGGGLDKNFLRFGRGGLDKNFLRFGRNIWQLRGTEGILDNGQVDVNRINQVLDNLRRVEVQQEEDEESASNGGGANSAGLEVDNVQQSDQLKTKRGSLNNNFLRYGRYNTDVFSGKRGSLDRNFLRFGKRSLQDITNGQLDDQRPNSDSENHILLPCSNNGQECDYRSTEPPGDVFTKLIKKRSLLDGHWMTTTDDDDDGIKSIRMGRSVDNSVLENGLQKNFIRFGKR